MFENFDRLDCLTNEKNGIILNDALFNYNYSPPNSKSNFLFCESQRKAYLCDILRCHDITYINSLKKKCEMLKTGNFKEGKDGIIYGFNKAGASLSMNSSTKKKEGNHLKHEEKNANNLFNYVKIDVDTFINEYTYENIFNTAGCVFDAIDLVMSGKSKNAFALIRPPGHHAGYYGPVENPIVDSEGFCIVNNVAIGAAYAKTQYRDKLKKIAIFDFDVHHGNGTEEIIKLLEGKNFNKKFIIDKSKSITFEETVQINWLEEEDPKNILFISTHLYNENNPKTFYPYSGSESINTPKDSPIYPGGIKNIVFPCKSNNPYDYRNTIRTKIIPRLEKFKPDIIFLSAGFDGHELEIINKHHMNLRESDFAFLTMQLQAVAHKFCDDRLVSVLEGGYNVSTGIISSFAQSVFVHARFLNISLNIFHPVGYKFSLNKQKQELDQEMKNYLLSSRNKNKPRRSERLRHQEDDKKKEEVLSQGLTEKAEINNDGKETGSVASHKHKKMIGEKRMPESKIEDVLLDEENSIEEDEMKKNNLCAF